MLDLHSHILYGVDDGINTKEESYEILKEYKEAGFSKVALTPHLYNPYVSTEVKLIRPHFEELQKWAKEELDLELLLGSEVFVGKQMKLLTLPIDNKYSLVEFDVFMMPTNLLLRLEDIFNKDLDVIIAHVERYRWFKPDSSLSKELKNAGCFFQMNAEAVKKKSPGVMNWIESGMIDIIASDNHGKPGLAETLRATICDYPEIKYRMAYFEE